MHGVARNIWYSILSGVLLALAFPKFNLFFLAWAALAPFFTAVVSAKNLKEALFCGLFFGLFFFGIDLFWVTTLFRFVGWWVFLGWVAFVLFQSVFILLFVLLVRVTRFRGVWLAIIWVLVEWLRAQGAFGATVGDIGYSQVCLLPLIQIASFTSVYGVSFLVVWVNAAIAEAGTKKNLVPTFLVLLLVISSYAYGSFVMEKDIGGSKPVIKLALIQPNIDQKDKMDPAKIADTFALQEKMSYQAARGNPEIIIWPETSVFSYLLRDAILFSRLQQLAIKTRAWLLIGTPYSDEGGKVYNSIVSISPQGKVFSRYDKQHLVPFGEYLPFREVLYPFLKKVGYYDQAFASNPAAIPVWAGKRKISAAVCFESAFPHLIRRMTSRDSAFILTVTNDAWFGDSSAPYFHLNTGILRAVENRKFFVQVGNSGITAVIDPYGRILARTSLNRREILTFEIPLS